MKFQVNSKSLEKLLSKVFPAIPSRTPMGILENFLFEINEGKITVTATDLELTLRAFMNVDADANLKIVTPAKLLYDIVRSLGDTTINFTTETNNKIKLNTDTGEYFIGYAEANEYPEIPEMEKGKSLEVNAEIFSEAIDTAFFAISKESVRPAMTGMLMEFSQEGLRFITTDGHRLVKFSAFSVTSHKGDAPKLVEQYILPERAVSVLSKLISTGNLSLTLSASTVLFKIDDVEFMTRLIGQKYPDYNSVIPIENENMMYLKRHELLHSIRRMLLFASTNYQQVKLSIQPELLEVYAEDVDHGSSAKEVIPISYNGEPMNIGFNTAYLNDVISHIKDDEIIFKLNSPTKACIITPAKQYEEKEIIMLLMPVRLNS